MTWRLEKYDDGGWRLSGRGLIFEIERDQIEALRQSCVSALGDIDADAEMVGRVYGPQIGDIHKGSGGVYNGKAWVVFQRVTIAETYTHIARTKPWGKAIEEVLDLHISEYASQASSNNRLFRLENHAAREGQHYQLGSFPSSEAAELAGRQLGEEVLAIWGDPPPRAEETPRRRRRVML